MFDNFVVLEWFVGRIIGNTRVKNKNLNSVGGRFPDPSSECLFGSAADLLRFGGMLAGGGVLEGRRVLSGAAVRLMLSDYNDEGLECQGYDTFGLGIGHCAAPEEPQSRCRTHEWWGWGSVCRSPPWRLRTRDC